VLPLVKLLGIGLGFLGKNIALTRDEIEADQ
jgi:hypothetical protein